MSETFQRVLRFFSEPRRGSKAEVEEVLASAKEFIEQHRRGIETIARQHQLLETMAHHMGGLVWIKRWDAGQNTYLYEFANRTHCEKFFCMEPECLDNCTAHVRGQSDMDLLNEFREKTGIRHSYGDLCVSTDVHATNQAILHYETGGELGHTSCRYIECGYIGDHEFVLEVVKTPLFDPNMPCKCWKSHTYTVGNALDVSACCDSRLAFAHQCLSSGQAERLQPGVFWLFPGREECVLLEEELPKDAT